MMNETLKRIAFFALGRHRSRIARRPLRHLRRRLVPACKRDQLDNEHLRMLLAFVLSPDSNCIDVGAGRGTVLKEIVRLSPNGLHIAYEPLPEFHSRLKAKFPQVDVRRAALSNESGEADFTYVPDRPCFSGFRRRTYPEPYETKTICVAVEKLDSDLPADYTPTLIKIDVEGAEEGVIEGAIKTISRHRPIVVFEHGRGAADHYGTRPSDIFRLLCEEAGLRIYDLDGGGPYTLKDFESTFESGERWNFVARI